MKNELTDIQERYLFTVADHFKREGRSPTRRELVRLVKQKSTHGVNQVLKALEKKGYIKIDPPGEARNIVLVRAPAKQLSLPRVGS